MANPGTGSIPDPPDVASILAHLEFAADESNWPIGDDFDAFLCEIIRSTNSFDAIRTSILRHLSAKGIDMKELVQRPNINGDGLPLLDALDVVRSAWAMGLNDHETEILTGIPPADQQAAHALGRLGFQRHARLREILRTRIHGNHNKAIGQILGLNHSYVARLFRRSGLPPYPSDYLVDQNSRRDEIIEMFNEGWTTRHIALKLKTTNDLVRNVVTRTRQKNETPVRNHRKPIVQPGVRPPPEGGFGRYAKKDDDAS